MTQPAARSAQITNVGGTRAGLVLRLATIALLVGAFLLTLIRSFYASEILLGPRNTEPVRGPQIERLLLIIIDGLRADTLYQSGCMPSLQRFAREHLHGEALATEITMTGVGVRAIGTGTSSGIAAIARNWREQEIAFDNLFASLAARGGRIAMVGNHTWMELFGRYVTIDHTQRRLSHLMHYINPVYGADLVWARRASELMGAHDWDLAVVHLGGLDNASHLYTPFGAEFCAKATDTDREVSAIIEAAGPMTTVIVTSDHGTGNRGHHGSGEPEARRCPVIFSGPGFVLGDELQVDQLDLAPTMAALLSLPIPYPAEGRVLTERLDLSPSERKLIAAADLRRATDYAQRFAAARGLSPPLLASPAELGPWVRHLRGNGTWLPLLLALALLFIALALGREQAEAGPETPLVPSLLGIALMGIGAWQIEQTSWLLGAGAGLTAALWGRRALQSVPVRKLSLFVLSLLPAEALIVFWRLHLRAAQLGWGALKGQVPSGELWLTPAMGVLGVAILWAARHRRQSECFRWGALLALSLFSDEMALPAALGALCVAALHPRGIGKRAYTLALLGVCLLTFLVPPATSQIPWTWGPLVVGLLCACDPKLGPGWSRPALIAVGMLGSAILWKGNATWPFRLYLAAGASVILAGPVLSAGRVRLVVAVAVLQLAFLSRVQHLPGLIGLAALAELLGQRLADSEDTLLDGALAILGLRMSYFWLFEGSFSFSALEIWVGYMANPGQHHVAGALVIAYKFLLPMFIAGWLVLGDQPPARRRTTLYLLAVFLCARLVQLTLSLLVGAGTYHSPYADIGQLFFNLLFAASIAILIAAFSLAAAASARKI